VFEAALSLTAALAEALIAHGCEIDLWLAPPHEGEAVVRGARLQDVLYMLAGAQRLPRDGFASFVDDLSQHLAEAQTAFVVCQVWDDAREELCFAVGQSGARALPLVVGAAVAPCSFDAHVVPTTTIAAGEVVLA
jgi:uncharacterized protein (DUF58 family)